MTASHPSRLTLAAFLASILFGSANAIGVRVTVAELPPFWGATLRFGTAGILLAIVVVARGLSFPRGGRLLGSVLFGLFNFGLAYVFLYWALRDVPAGTTQVVLSIVPLLTLLFAVGQGMERFRLRGLAGALIAAAGIVVVFLDQADLNVPVGSLLAVVAGAACIAEAGVLAKRFPPGNPVAANAVGMLVAGALLLALTLVTGQSTALPTRPETWLAVGYLIVFGSIAVFILVLYVLARWTASATSYAFLLIPLATVVLAAILLHEPIQPDFVVGAVLVLAGVYVGAFSGGRTERAGRTEPAEAAAPAGGSARAGGSAVAESAVE